MFKARRRYRTTDGATLSHLPTSATGAPQNELTDFFEDMRRSLTAASMALRCVEMGIASQDLTKLAAVACEESLLRLRAVAEGMRFVQSGAGPFD